LDPGPQQASHKNLSLSNAHNGRRASASADGIGGNRKACMRTNRKGCMRIRSWRTLSPRRMSLYDISDLRAVIVVYIIFPGPATSKRNGAAAVA